MLDAENFWMACCYLFSFKFRSAIWLWSVILAGDFILWLTFLNHGHTSKNSSVDRLNKSLEIQLINDFISIPAIHFSVLLQTFKQSDRLKTITDLNYPSKNVTPHVFFTHTRRCFGDRQFHCHHLSSATPRWRAEWSVKFDRDVHRQYGCNSAFHLDLL